jgi:hypothetical protein
MMDGWVGGCVCVRRQCAVWDLLCYVISLLKNKEGWLIFFPPSNTFLNIILEFDLAPKSYVDEEDEAEEEVIC